MIGPCAKQVVTATIIAKSGHVFVGQNDCHNPQSFCPRGGLPSGVGYERCAHICQQTGHAEVNALGLAKAFAAGATLFLEGHTYACDDCKAACEAAGIEEIVIGPPAFA